MARIASGILASAIIKATQGLGGSAYVMRRGAQESGAIFVTFYKEDSRLYDIYEPVAQAFLSDEKSNSGKRYFSLLEEDQDSLQVSDRFEREAKFDPDCWVIELEGLSVDQLADFIPLI